MTRQTLIATMANMVTKKYSGVSLLNWSGNEITFQHDGGYETLNRQMILSTTLTTEILQ